MNLKIDDERAFDRQQAAEMAFRVGEIVRGAILTRLDLVDHDRE